MHVHIVQNVTEPPRQPPSVSLQSFKFKKEIAMTANFRKSIVVQLVHHAAFALTALPFCWSFYRGKTALLS